MPDLEGLLGRYESLSKDILKLASDGRKVIVVTHVDADGLASGSAVFAALTRAGANVTVRCVPDLDPKLIGELASQRYDFHIFTDLASTLLAELEDAFDGRFLVIDHHQLSEQDMQKPTVVNAWRYGYDGGREACSASMAYLFARAASPSNRDLAPLAVVGAVADRQDAGPNRSLTGLNRVSLEDAQSAGLVTASKDLLFTGRETRPIHEAVALTSTPYLPGLTGSKDLVLSTLHQAGLRLKDGGSWRTISSLDSAEKGKLTEVIAANLGATGGGADALNGLVGEVYTLEFEDAFTPLRDAREFATLLNACGRMGVTGTGVSVCLGERSEALNSAMRTLAEYRVSLNRSIQGLVDDPSRMERHGTLVIVGAGGLVDEKLLGPVASILTSSPEYRDKVVVALTNSGDSQLKVSSRVGD
ncbi:MAG TPA: DHH family phosphoesterase, partial [Nitrososphaerales archaeon]|nr:DHH family phosphoesterase [Nitrososphaerales archaeon]